MSANAPQHAGFVAVVGRPNVGKSTLVNALVGAKVAIVSRRPQSTRRRILGVVNAAGCQIVLVDSPGLHAGAGRALDLALNAGTRRAAADADALLLVTEAGRWTEGDERALALAAAPGRPIVLVLNKIDRIRPRSRLLPLLSAAAERHPFAALVPVSARGGDNIGRVPEALCGLLPLSPPLFPPGQITDQSAAEQAAETIREALIERVGDELPYATYVTVEHWREGRARTEIEAVVWVARESQKGIVIGAGGRMTKAIGTAARQALEQALGGQKVMLRLWVRVRPGWNEDARVLSDLGLGR